MIDVGLIGYGLAGRSFHAPVIRAVPGLRLAAILERTGNDAAKKYPDVPIVRTLDELLAIKEIRLIVIATPNDSHFPLAQRCFAAGRDVLVDKPFTTTLEEAIALVEFAKQQGRFLTSSRVANSEESFALNPITIAFVLSFGRALGASAPALALASFSIWRRT
jgi:scyllo-inositol 2-dehydrogenase (NADP+)